MNIQKGVISLNVTLDKQQNKAVIFVSMTPRSGRTPAVRCRPVTVRDILKENGVELGALISGSSIHNNMSRRLGERTLDDLKTTMVFAIEDKAPEPVPVVKKASKPKAKPKVKAAPKPEPKVEIKAAQPAGEAAGETAPEVKAKPKRTTRAKSTRTRSTRAKKGENK